MFPLSRLNNISYDYLVDSDKFKKEYELPDNPNKFIKIDDITMANEENIDSINLDDFEKRLKKLQEERDSIFT